MMICEYLAMEDKGLRSGFKIFRVGHRGHWFGMSYVLVRIW